MRMREEWKEADEHEMLGRLRGAMSRKPVDWGEISDILWWAGRKDEEGGDVMLRYMDYLRHHLREHAGGGGGWCAGERRIWTFEGVEFAMRWVPAGSFLMGAGADDTEAFVWEKPQREVTITRGFWMGEVPVTQGQYQAITGQNPSHFKKAGLDAPVEEVSWYDVAAFANKLSAMEGVSACFVGTGKRIKGVGNKGSDYLGCKGWRLPTEAEWEYACRAGTTTPRYGALDDIARYHDNSGYTTYPVRQKEGNAWGLYDTLGNVWEWVYDVYGDYEGMGTRDPLRTNGGAKRVSRGGGWHNNARHMRSAVRDSDAPTNRYDNLGFRVVRSGF